MSDYETGFNLGLSWEGPHGDGSLGVLSLDFVREQAEMHAAGFRFDELEYVTEEEWEAAEAFMRGFRDGLAACMTFTPCDRRARPGA